jgi:3-methylcrotonyl-CoA carboxylase alpha subunit
MIAKIIAHAETREDAADAVAAEMLNLAVWPVRTNAAFLINLLQDPEFLDGDVQTGFIAQRQDRLTAFEPANEAVLNSAAEALLPPEDFSVWELRSGFRLNGPSNPRLRLADESGAMIEFDQGPGYDPAFTHVVDGKAIHPFMGKTFSFSLYRPGGVAGTAAGDGAIVSPMPGKIIALEVAAGDAVTKGQKLLTLEAMKMEHSLTAPFDGKVAELNAAAGAQGSEGALLVRIEKGED